MPRLLWDYAIIYNSVFLEKNRFFRKYLQNFVERFCDSALHTLITEILRTTGMFMTKVTVPSSITYPSQVLVYFSLFSEKTKNHCYSSEQIDILLHSYFLFSFATNLQQHYTISIYFWDSITIKLKKGSLQWEDKTGNTKNYRRPWFYTKWTFKALTAVYSLWKVPSFVILYKKNHNTVCSEHLTISYILEHYSPYSVILCLSLFCLIWQRKHFNKSVSDINETIISKLWWQSNHLHTFYFSWVGVVLRFHKSKN